MAIVNINKFMIRYNGKILVLKESDDYLEDGEVSKYYFPWTTENDPKAILDLIKVETGLDVVMGEMVLEDHYIDYIQDQEIHNNVRYFVADAKSDNVVLQEDYDDYAWVDMETMHDYEIEDHLIKPLEKIFA